MPAPAPAASAQLEPDFKPAHPKLDALFRAMSKMEVSDLHIKANRQPHFRVHSQLRAVDQPPLTPAEIDDMVKSLLNEDQLKEYHDFNQVDLAYEVPGSDRFRINIYHQRGHVSIAARRVTRNIPNFEALNLPPEISSILGSHQGLVLLAGPTGSGKSTTIASMLQWINQNRRCHIVTIEDPIEYLYEDSKALINQREIGIDVPNFALALRAMLREDPDVVLVGEMRDMETFEAALQASETGHLVFGTIHASTAPQTISRILELFPTERRNLILQSLAFSLNAIVCQKLLPCIKEGVSRVPAVEILRNTPVVRDLLEKGRDGELGDVIRSNEKDGMRSFTKSLHELIETNLIEPKVAYEVAPNAEELKMMLKGINQSRGGLLGGRL